MFPTIPLHLILIDLTRTYSVDATVQNIVNGNILQFLSHTDAAATRQVIIARTQTHPPTHTRTRAHTHTLFLSVILSNIIEQRSEGQINENVNTRYHMVQDIQGTKHLS